MKVELSNTFGKSLKRSIERYDFEVGVLQDKPHYTPVEAKRGEPLPLKQYAGGPARKQTRQASDLSVGQVLIANMKRLNRNFLLEPFQKESTDLIRFTREFLKSALARTSPKRVENLLQAVVRNPILRGEYGSNNATVADNKGFDRHLIDTAQMFKAIRAKANRRA